MKICKLHILIIVLLLIIIAILTYKMITKNYEKIRYYENFKASNKYLKCKSCKSCSTYNKNPLKNNSSKNNNPSKNNRQNSNNVENNDAEDNEDNNQDNNQDNFVAKIINNKINGKELDQNRCKNWKLTKNLLTGDCIQTVTGISNKVSLEITRDCKPINCVKNKKAELRCNTCND